MIRQYLSLIKFSHTIFALPFALIGLFLGFENGENKTIDLTLSLSVIACMVFARSAAMAFNRYIDRKFDALNPRTASREIPAGQISPGAALLFTMLTSIGFMLAAKSINTLCFYLSPVALIVILGYSVTKRFTALCHLVLGLGLSLAPVGAYIAVTEKFALIPILFSIIVFCWVSGFDIIYALQDEEFDRSVKLHSIPALFGKKRALNISRFLHLITGSMVMFAGFYYPFHLLYFIGAGIFTVLLIFQQQLVKPHDLSKVNLAFGTTNGIASVIFAIFTIGDLLFY